MSLAYSVQVIVVFLCPAFFGWAVLRRVVREHDYLVLLPGSVVVGSVALMATVNELRYWLEMSVAAWFAYKVLLAAGLALLVFTQQPRFRPRLAGGPHRAAWAWIAASGTLVTLVYFGIPAAHNFLNDSWWFHYPAATLVQDLKFFPIPSVFAPDDPLYYHFGPDILAGTWAYLLDRTVQVGFAVSIGIFAPSTFLLSYAIVLRGCRSHFGALSAAAFIVAGGNLLFLRLLTAHSFLGLGILEKLNSGSVDGLLKLMFTPSHACGIPAVLLGVLIFWRFWSRPSWALATLLGLWTGALTLIAEWYFFVFAGAVVIYFLVQTFAERRRRRLDGQYARNLSLRAAVLLIAIGWGFFNNTYVSGIFAHFWMHSERPDLIARARLEQARFVQHSTNAEASQIYARLFRKLSGNPEAKEDLLLRKRLSPTLASEQLDELGSDIDLPLSVEPWTPPNLVPLRLNLHHFGQIPSWAGAGSSGGTFVSMFGLRFLAECTPVILFGLPFGLWLAVRKKQPILRVFVLLAILSMAPPIFLDWGFRSTDFLRFFTGAFSFSALLLGWLVGHMWNRGTPAYRFGAVAICIGALINPFIIGLLGLRSSTFEAVQNVNQSAGSLKDAALAEKEKSKMPPALPSPKTPSPDSVGALQSQSVPLSYTERRVKAFNKMAELARRYLYPQTRGRDRAIVIVPKEETPPTEVFPDWLKLATLAHVQLPIGWYWNNSYYATYYREAVTTLSPESVTALDARWIIVSNLFGPPPPEAVRVALKDPRRFVIVQSYMSGPFSMEIYRAFPYSAPPPGTENE